MPPESNQQSNDQMVEGTFSDEALNSWLAELGDEQVALPSLGNPLIRAGFTPEGEETDVDGPTTDESGETPDNGEEEPEAQEPAPDNDSFTVNGQSIPRSEIERLYQFDQFMRANPEAAQRVAAAIQPPVPSATSVPTGTSEPEPTVTTVDEWTEPTPPEGLDLEDPRDKFIWDSMVSLQKSQYDLAHSQQAFHNQQQQERAQQVQRQAQEDMQSALSTFRTRYTGLNDDEVNAIRMNAVPFVQGMMATMSPVDALYRSLEVAAHMDPDLSTKLAATTPTPTSTQRSQHRKSRLSSIAGTTRSAPKTDQPARFQSDKDAISAFAEALSDQMTGR